MDFFARQERTKRTTAYLVLLFALAFLGVAAAATLAVAIVLNFLPDLETPLLSTTVGGQSRIDLLPLVGIAAGMLLFMLLASLIRTGTLARGGAQIAQMLGASEVSRNTNDPLHQRLINVVEEIAIASGLPVPRIFILEREPAINAFAAGLHASDAAITVTQGALERLDRAELQGVVAHEFGHILNGDTRLNQRLIGYCFGILVLALVGRWLLRSARFTRRARNRGVSVAIFLGLALTIIGSVGMLFSRIIKAAVSRQRELLADASAVQFTREPSGLAGALKKIGGFTANLSSVDSEEVAHMLFGPGSKAFRGLFATHPPLIERIKALDPSFDGDLLASTSTESSSGAATWPDAHALARPAATQMSNDDVLDRTGTIEPPGIGRGLHAAIPASLHDSARSRESSFLLVLAMALADEPEIARRQEQLLEQRLGLQRAAVCTRLRAELTHMPTTLWLPLLELSVPALNLRPSEQVDFLFNLLAELRGIDPHYRVQAFILPRMLDAYLGRRSGMHSGAQVKTKMSLEEAVNELLASMAVVGHDDASQAEAAYRASVGALRFGKAIEPTISASQMSRASRLINLETAIERLRDLAPSVKRELLRATLVAIRFDEQISGDEIELYRSIAAALDCPVPPIAAGATAGHSQ